MNLVLCLMILATAMNGLLSGLNVDTALVKLPARRRIGVVAYAAFARGNDLGNGLVVYPILGIGAALFTVLATVIAYLGALSDGVALAAFPCFPVESPAHSSHDQSSTSDVECQRRTE